MNYIYTLHIGRALSLSRSSLKKWMIIITSPNCAYVEIITNAATALEVSRWYAPRNEARTDRGNPKRGKRSNLVEVIRMGWNCAGNSRRLAGILIKN